MSRSSKRKRQTNLEEQLAEAQRITRERMAGGADPEQLGRLHKEMHPDPDMTIRQKHLDRGDTIEYEDDELVLYKPAPDGPPERFRQLQGVLQINFDAGEDFFESQVYRTIPFADLTVPPFEFKFLAKTRPDGRVSYVFKGVRPDGGMFMHAESQGWVTEEAYREAVVKTMELVGSIGVISEPTIQTQADYHHAQQRSTRP